MPVPPLSTDVVAGLPLVGLRRVAEALRDQRGALLLRYETGPGHRHVIRELGDQTGVAGTRVLEAGGCCASCTVLTDLAAALRVLPGHPDAEHLVVQLPRSAALSDARSVVSAAAAAGTGSGRRVVAGDAVAVVDAGDAVHDLLCSDDCGSRGLALSDEDDRLLAACLVEQLEQAQVVVRAGLLGVDHLAARHVGALLERLSPGAVAVDADRDGVTSRPLPSGRRGRPVLGMDRQVLPEPAHLRSAEGVRAAVWRSRRPLHPEKLAPRLGEVADLVRARGLLWTADEPRHRVVADSAGGRVRLHRGHPWLDGLGPAALTGLPAWVVEEADRRWSPWAGDRGSEVVLVGATRAVEVAGQTLTACVVSDAEIAAGSERWTAWSPLLPVDPPSGRG